jgi:hypothetical protein
MYEHVITEGVPERFAESPSVSIRIKIIDDDGLLTHEAMQLATELAAEEGIFASEARNVLAGLERKGYQIVKPD